MALSLNSTIASNPYLSTPPSGFTSNASGSTWGFYSTLHTAALPAGFNRTLFLPPWQANTSNQALHEALVYQFEAEGSPSCLTPDSNEYFDGTNFVAFDPAFFDFIGPEAKIEQVWSTNSSYNHEASCFVTERNALFFTSWGFDHSYQYLLDGSTHQLHNITTSPPIMNAHGCVYFNGSLRVATDGGAGTYASIYRVDPHTLKAETLINNFYQQPFIGFNDLQIDPNGNIWVTDSMSAWSNYLTTFAPQTGPAVYFINTTTMTPKWVFEVEGGVDANTNGIAFAADGTLYIDTTSISSGRPKGKFPLRSRAIWALDTNGGEPQLGNRRLFYNPISYFCDGVRVSRNGYVFCATGDGVDVVDPESGYALGRIRISGKGNVAVNIAFEDHTLWIVGKGGVWKVTGIKEQLKRTW